MVQNAIPDHDTVYSREGLAPPVAPARARGLKRQCDRVLGKLLDRAREKLVGLAKELSGLRQSYARVGKFALINDPSVPAAARVGPEVGVELKIAYRRARPSAMEGRPCVGDDEIGRDQQPEHVLDFVRDGSVGKGAARMGNSRWRRLARPAGGRKHAEVASI